MINLKQKSYYALVVLFCLSLIFVGCEEDPGELRIEQNEETIADADLENEYLNFTQGLDQDQLKALAVEIGKFINEPEVRAEVISYATEESQGEVYIPFAEILAEEAEGGRLNSIVRERLKEALQSVSCENCRTETIEEILSAEYSLYAPYLAEYHSDSEIPLTISWIDETYPLGTTPDIFTGSSSSGRVASDQIIPVDDTYAVNQPVAIIAPPDPGDYPIAIDDGVGGGSGGSGGGSTTGRSIDCRDLSQDDIVRVRMPEWRLIDNIRWWPWGNYLTLRVVTGAQSPAVLTREFHITRADARDKRWKQTDFSFLQSDWQESEIDMSLIVTYKKGQSEVEVSGKNTFKEDGVETQIGWKVTSTDNEKEYFQVPFSRCSTLGDLSYDRGFGKRNGLQVYQNIDLQYYFDVEIQ